MTAPEIGRVLWQRRLIVIGTVLVALITAGAIWAAQPREYTASIRLYVSAPPSDPSLNAYQGAQLSQQRVVSYVELVTDPQIGAEVVRDLGLSESPQQLVNQLSASSAPDSVLIDVSVRDTSPERAARIADAVAAVMGRVVDELERPATTDAPAPVVLRAVRPAAVPVDPSSLRLSTVLAAAALAGLVVGAGLAFARHALDTTVRTSADLDAMGAGPVLGSIAFDRSVPNSPMVVHDESRTARGEAFRRLRTNLQFVDVDRPPAVIVMTSSVPGEGKSTAVANLALAHAAAGRRVILVDADLRRPQLAALTGLERSVGLTTVLAGMIRMPDAVQSFSRGVDLLASGSLPPNPSELLASGQMSAVLSDLRARYDLVLVDTPPLVPVTDAAAVAPATDGVVLLCRARRTRRDQLGTSLRALEGVRARLLGTVLTMVPASATDRYERYGYASAPEHQEGRGPRHGGAPRPSPTPVDRDVAPRTAEPLR